MFQRNYQHLLQFFDTEYIIQKNSAWHSRSLVFIRYVSFTRFILHQFTLQESSTWVIPNSLSFLQHPKQHHTSMSLPLMFNSNGTAFMKPSIIYQSLSSLCCCSTSHSLNYSTCHNIPWFLVHLSALPLVSEVLVDTFNKFN